MKLNRARVFNLVVGCFITVISSFADAQQDRVGCDQLRDISGVVRLGMMADDSESLKVSPLIEELYASMCSFISPTDGSTIYYRNGQVATQSANRVGATWRYSNGQVATQLAGQKGSTWYFPNGQAFTQLASQKGATWYYPNGKTVTQLSGQEGATWYYPNGQAITQLIGQQGATWYYPNGNVISNTMGNQGATWYFPEGQTWMSSGPKLSKQQLLNPYDILSQIFWQIERQPIDKR